MNKNILIAVAALGGLILIASLVPDNSDTNVEIVTTEDQDTTISEQAMPAVPQYPNATMISSKETSRDADKIYYAFVLETTDSVAEINEWYRQALSSNGWSIKSDRNIAGYQLIQGETERFYTSMQAATFEGDKVRISQQAQVKISLN
jgi:hypothetical protein